MTRRTRMLLVTVGMQPRGKPGPQNNASVTLQPLTHGTQGSRFRVAEGGVFRVRLLHTGEDDSGRSRGPQNMSNGAALMASNQLRASERRRLGESAIKQWPPVLGRQRATLEDQIPDRSDKTAAINIAVLARAAMDETMHRLDAIAAAHARGKKPLGRVKHLLQERGLSDGRTELRSAGVTHDVQKTRDSSQHVVQQPDGLAVTDHGACTPQHTCSLCRANIFRRGERPLPSQCSSAE